MMMMDNFKKEIQENTGKQLEAHKEETQKSLKELKENTTKQVKELNKTIKELKMEVETIKKSQRETLCWASLSCIGLLCACRLL